MGGDAFLIPVTPSPELQPAQPGFVGRLLGRRPNPDELPTAPFRKALWTDFRAWLRKEAEPPWPATRAQCEYLDTIGWTLYVRRYDGGWFLQITWSGCAGVAEASAALAAHWTRLWWEARAPSVPGLTPDPHRWPERSDPLFVQVEDAYLMWTGDWKWDDALESPPDVSALTPPERCGCQLCARRSPAS